MEEEDYQTLSTVLSDNKTTKKISFDNKFSLLSLTVAPTELMAYIHNTSSVLNDLLNKKYFFVLRVVRVTSISEAICMRYSRHKHTKRCYFLHLCSAEAGKKSPMSLLTLLN
jgi:hypothetical protein